MAVSSTTCLRALRKSPHESRRACWRPRGWLQIRPGGFDGSPVLRRIYAMSYGVGMGDSDHPLSRHALRRNLRLDEKSHPAHVSKPAMPVPHVAVPVCIRHTLRLVRRGRRCAGLRRVVSCRVVIVGVAIRALILGDCGTSKTRSVLHGQLRRPRACASNPAMLESTRGIAAARVRACR